MSGEEDDKEVCKPGRFVPLTTSSQTSLKTYFWHWYINQPYISGRGNKNKKQTGVKTGERTHALQRNKQEKNGGVNDKRHNTWLLSCLLNASNRVLKASD